MQMRSHLNKDDLAECKDDDTLSFTIRLSFFSSLVVVVVVVENDLFFYVSIHLDSLLNNINIVFV